MLALATFSWVCPYFFIPGGMFKKNHGDSYPLWNVITCQALLYPKMQHLLPTGTGQRWKHRLKARECSPEPKALALPWIVAYFDTLRNILYVSASYAWPASASPYMSPDTHIENINHALTGVAQWIESWPVNQKVAGFLVHQCFSPSLSLYRLLSLKISKWNLFFTNKVLLMLKKKKEREENVNLQPLPWRYWCTRFGLRPRNWYA